jgi:hypothetical protein
VAEWLKAHAWKACIWQHIEGSNPFPSAKDKITIEINFVLQTKNQIMQNIDVILKNTDEIKIIEAVGTHIWAKKQKTDLNEFEQVFVNLDIFEAAMNEGGFKHFFNTENGNYAEEIIHSYKQVGAKKSALIISKSLEVFTNNSYIEDLEVRQIIIAKLPETAFETWDDLNELFFQEEEEDVVTLVVNYIKKNKDSFCNEYSS